MDIETLIDQLPVVNLGLFSFREEQLGFPSISLKPLGEGAFGSIYSYDTKVIKTQEPCASISNIPCVRQYCTILNDPKAIISPYPINKTNVSLPNSWSEAYIGGILTKLVNAKYTRSFPRYNQLAYIPEKKGTVIIFERLYPHVPQLIRDENDFIVYLFQIVHGLMVAQEMTRFTHYDLHLDNILYRYIPKIGYTTYPLSNGTNLYLRNIGFECVITDFGLSRCEYGNIIVTPQVDNCPQVSYGMFNPFYDIMSVIGNLIMGIKGPITTLFNSFSLEFQMLILDGLFGDPEPNIQTRYNNYKRHYIGWRPQDLSQIRYVKTLMCYAYAEYLSNLLIARQYGILDVDVNNILLQPLNVLNRLPQYRYIPGIKPLAKNINFVTGDGITIRSYVEERVLPINEYARNISTRRRRSCGIRGQNVSTQNITEVIINKAVAFANRYELKLECCGIDPSNFFYENDRWGVVVNAGINVDIPPLYANDYVVVYVVDGNIGILKYVDRGNIPVDAVFITVGSLLISEGVKVFDINKLRTVAPNHPYQCDGGSAVIIDESCNVNTAMVDVGNVVKCENSKIGELRHASSSLPRSMLILTGNEIIFVMIGIESDGLDLAELTDLAAEKYNPLYAIGLEGELNTNMATRFDDDIYAIDIVHMDLRPLKNVFTITKPF